MKFLIYKVTKLKSNDLKKLNKYPSQIETEIKKKSEPRND